MKGRFVDIHHHLLYRMDDGPKQIDGMKDMIDSAYRDGAGLIIATPHAAPGVKPFDMVFYEQVLMQANEYCIEKGYDLRIYGGSEIMYTAATVRLMRDEQIPSLAGTRFILVEWPSHVSVSEVSEAVRNMTNAGYIPVMAHTERLKCFHGRINVLHQLKDCFQVRLQVNADAIVMGTSFFSRNVVSHLLRSKLVDYVASDAHDVQMRKVQMEAAYLKLCSSYGTEYADELTHDNPMEIIKAIDQDS